jgi:hypothetical protein
MFVCYIHDELCPIPYNKDLIPKKIKVTYYSYIVSELPGNTVCQRLYVRGRNYSNFIYTSNIIEVHPPQLVSSLTFKDDLCPH